MWNLHGRCEEFIAKCWFVQVIDCPMFFVSKKSQLLKSELKTWNKEVFGNIHVLIQNASAKPTNIHAQLIGNEGNKELNDQEVIPQKELEKVFTMEEVFWKDKAKSKWHLEGHKYIFICSKIRMAKNIITHIITNEGLLHDPDEMEAHVSYFTNLFSVLHALLLTFQLWMG